MICQDPDSCEMTIWTIYLFLCKLPSTYLPMYLNCVEYPTKIKIRYISNNAMYENILLLITYVNTPLHYNSMPNYLAHITNQKLVKKSIWINFKTRRITVILPLKLADLISKTVKVDKQRIGQDFLPRVNIFTDLFFFLYPSSSFFFPL